MKGDENVKDEETFVFDDERDTADGPSADERPTEYADAATAFATADEPVPPTAPAAPADAATAEDDEEEEGDGETRGMETRAGSMEEILALKRDYERKVKARKTMHLVLIVAFVAALVGVYFVTQRNRETDWMSIPKDPATGNAAVREYLVSAPDGGTLLRVDYPVSKGMSVTKDPDGGGIEVVSRMGRDADVPYYLRFECRRSADELKLSLVDSVWRWVQVLQSEAGFLFDVNAPEDVKPKFFEDVFAWCCEEETLYGVRFVMLPYQRTRPDRTTWRGIAIYLRSGDAAYSLRREIPISQWKRGQGQLMADPNLAVFARFAHDYWESPGADGLPLDWPSSQLAGEIRRGLHPARPGMWVRVRKWIDALLAKEWRGDADMHESGMRFLKQLREYQKNFYWGEYNALEAAKAVDRDKRVKQIRQDCKAVFQDPSDRRYYLVGDGKVW